MWAVRVLSGPQAGQVFPLSNGTNVVGRSTSARVNILSPGVSKEHLQIDVLDDKLIMSDMGSRNGSFLNGVKVKRSRLHHGDKLLLHDTFIEITQLPANWAPPQMNASFATHPQAYGNAAHQMYPQAGHHAGPQPQMHYNDIDPQLHAEPHAQGGFTPEKMRGGIHGFQTLIENYLDRVVLPGVYKLPQLLEFRWVLSLIMAGFIFMVTSLSTIPLLRILKESVEEESQQHAMTIADNLAQINRGAIIQGQDSAVSVDIALKRPGVKEALVISNMDGNIIAPSSKAGTYPDIAFVHEARLKGRPDVAQVDGDTVVAVYPIEVYNNETGTQAVAANTVVVYDMSSMSVDDGKTLSLFVQTLFIALIVGSILFYFMYKMIEYPFKSLNLQLDSALKEGRDDLNHPYEFPALQALISNVNSALNRVANGGSSESGPVLEHDRNQEMAHLIDLVGFPALAIYGSDQTIAAVNPAFEDRTGLNSMDLIHNSIEKISDQALKLSVVDLLQRSHETPDQMLTNELEFSGENYQVAIQAVYGTQAIAYYIVVLLPMDPGGGDE